VIQATGVLNTACREGGLSNWGRPVTDPTWIDVAYTWAWPGSQWRARAMRRLEEQDTYPAGRYGRWVFQGIAESVRDGFMVGSSFRANS